MNAAKMWRMPVRPIPPGALPDLDWEAVITTVGDFLDELQGLDPVTQAAKGVSFILDTPKPTSPHLDELLAAVLAYCELVRIQVPLGLALERLAGRSEARRIANQLRNVARRARAKRSIQGPSLPLDALHPLAWTQAVQDLWRAGKLRLALQEAAHSIELALQIKSGSDLTDFKLNNHCFGTPPLLHVTRHKADSRLWKEDQRSALMLGQAVFTAVRNPSVHDHGDPSWEIAFELLALASAYARLVEQSK